jgi:hypothetical protein
MDEKFEEVQSIEPPFEFIRVPASFSGSGESLERNKSPWFVF